MNIKLDPTLLDAGYLIVFSNLLKLWTLVCTLEKRPLLLEYSTYQVINRTMFCECSFLAGPYFLLQTMLSCQDNTAITDGLFSMYYICLAKFFLTM